MDNRLEIKSRSETISIPYMCYRPYTTFVTHQNRLLVIISREYYRVNINFTDLYELKFLYKDARPVVFCNMQLDSIHHETEYHFIQIGPKVDWLKLGF